jgi:hypothetical protein
MGVGTFCGADAVGCGGAVVGMVVGAWIGWEVAVGGACALLVAGGLVAAAGAAVGTDGGTDGATGVHALTSTDKTITAQTYRRNKPVRLQPAASLTMTPLFR